MSRGRRKRGQLQLKVWSPEGDIMEIATTKDLSAAELLALFDEWAARARVWIQPTLGEKPQEQS